jgi:hypothetical protein
VELVRWTSKVKWRSFNEENRKLAQHSSSHLKTLNAPPSHILEVAWSHMNSYGRAGLVVEATMTVDRSDCLKRQGSVKT